MLLVGSDLTIQFGASSGFPGASCLKSFRSPDGMEPHRVLVPNVVSVTKSGCGLFSVDALVVFLISPDAGFDLAQLERAGLSKNVIDAAGLKLPKVSALAVRCMICVRLRVCAFLSCFGCTCCSWGCTCLKCLQVVSSRASTL
jgi:hypothetical protein